MITPSLPKPLIKLADALNFTRKGYEFRELVSKADPLKAYRFRYEVCVLGLKWVEGDPASSTEIDQYDPYSYHFGCFKDGEIVGYMRMTRENSPSGIMSRNHFQELWHSNPDFPIAQTADISRLFVRKQYLKQSREAGVILTGLYRLAHARAVRTVPEIRYWYFITSKRLIFALKWKLGFPIHVLGNGITSDGKTTYAAAVDLAKARRRQRLKAPLRHRYFTSL